jgi:F-type H+-transporting ATPase subunit delta
MSQEMVARRYARALFEVGAEKKQLDKVRAHMNDFAGAYEASAEFRAVAVLPTLSDEQRDAVVREIGKRIGALDVVTSTVSLLARRQRLFVLPEVARLIDTMADDHLGVVRAQVTSAGKLSASYLSRLEKKIADATGKKVVIDFHEDPELIAGVVTRIGDRVIDGSVRGKLDELAESLRHG